MKMKRSQRMHRNGTVVLSGTLQRLLCLFIVLFIATGTYAQSVLTGKVTDAAHEPLIGATIAIEGQENKGTITDIDGNYKLSLPAGTKQAVIKFQYVGFITRTIRWKGEQTLNITLEEESQELNEVVVTALGIKREEKGLGFSTTKVDNDMLSSAMPASWTSSLSGKVAGLNIVTPGGPVGTSRINLRGDVSLNQNGNNALIVVDGVPLSNTITNSGFAYGAGANTELPVDFGTGFSDLNVDDIESIQVLKGTSATALYGSRAANGVIMITTKTANSASKGLGVSFNSNTSFEQAMNFPNYQYEFGQGYPAFNKDNELYYLYYQSGGQLNGMSDTGHISVADFGPRFDPNKSFYQYDPETQAMGANPTPWVPYKDNRTGLFQTGVTSTNSVAVSNNWGNGNSVRASVTYTDNKWILPNTGFNRTVASVSARTQISRNLSINLRSSYTHRKIDNTPGLGYNSNSISYWLIFQNANIDLDWFKPRWYSGQENLRQLMPFTTYLANPYVILYESTNSSKKDEFINSLTANLTLSPKFDLMVRSGIQMYADERGQRRPISDIVFANGYYKQEKVTDYEINSDVLLTYHDSYANGLSINASVGGNLMRRNYSYLGASVTGLVTPGIYKLSNGVSSPFVTSERIRKAINSVYFSANFNWKNLLFLDVTGRNDWSSTLPKDNRSFFYPSVSASASMTDIFTLPEQISFFKLRASWAQVGNDTDPYSTMKYYETSNFPGSAVNPTTLYNTDFKPEISTSFEVGTDFRMFDNRIGIDLTYYQNVTKNQIISSPLDASSGYTSAIINAGKVRNRGVEVTFNATPVKTRDFTWNTTITWSKNKNRILELAEGSDDYQIISQVGAAYLVGKVGGSVGDIWGCKIVRNENGDVLIDPANGLPVQSTEIEYVGTATPKWKGGFYNEFRYKNFKLSFLIDGQWKGMAYSQTHHKLTELGKLEHTLNGRLPGTHYYIAGDDPRLAAAGLPAIGGVYMIGDGVIDNGDGTYRPNDIPVTTERWYYTYYRRANVEENTFDTSFLKLREMRFEYALPQSFLAKTPFKKAVLALYGRNLFILSNFPAFDPEVAALNGSSIVQGVEMGQLPSTRSYGFNINVEF